MLRMDLRRLSSALALAMVQGRWWERGVRDKPELIYYVAVFQRAKARLKSAYLNDLLKSLMTSVTAMVVSSSAFFIAFLVSLFLSKRSQTFCFLA